MRDVLAVVDGVEESLQMGHLLGNETARGDMGIKKMMEWQRKGW